VWKEAYRWLLSSGKSEEARKVLASLGYSNKVSPLGKSLAINLYGWPFITSVSRLERFQACPFQHFARDGLGLKEREVYELDPKGSGNFLHEALKQFVLEVFKPEQLSGRLDLEHTLNAVEKVASRLIPTVENEIFLSSARYKYISKVLTDVLKRAAQTFVEHINRGKFWPVAVEVPFGFEGGLPFLRIEISGKEDVLVRGQIDRIDVARCDRDVYLRVIDYKSAQKHLSFLQVYHGLSLQLLVYILVALTFWRKILKLSPTMPKSQIPEWEGKLDRGRVLPAGALYFTVYNPFIRTKAPLSSEEASKSLKKELKMTGVLVKDYDVLRLMDETSSDHSDLIPVRFTKKGDVSGSSIYSQDDFEMLLDFVKEKVKKISREIMSGKIDISPCRQNEDRACKRCPYGAFCNFDVLVDGNEYRTLKPLSKDRIFDKIRSLLQEPGSC